MFDNAFIIFFAILFGAFGLWSIIRPKSVFRFQYIFTVKNPEPTELAITMVILRGILFIIISIVFIVLAFLI